MFQHMAVLLPAARSAHKSVIILLFRPLNVLSSRNKLKFAIFDKILSLRGSESTTNSKLTDHFRLIDRPTVNRYCEVKNHDWVEN